MNVSSFYHNKGVKIIGAACRWDDNFQDQLFWMGSQIALKASVSKEGPYWNLLMIILLSRNGGSYM